MKFFKSVFAAAAASLLFSSVAMADVSTQGQSDPNTFTINGSIDKYIHFTQMDTNLNVNSVLAPNIAGYDFHTPGYSTFPSGSQGNGTSADAALITFDSNSHVRLDIGAWAPLTTTDANGHVYTLPTALHYETKGRGISNGFVYYDHAYGPRSIYFQHGPDSGINVSLMVDRNGLNDHAGTYTTTIPLTWSDLG